MCPPSIVTVPAGLRIGVVVVVPSSRIVTAGRVRDRPMCRSGRVSRDGRLPLPPPLGTLRTCVDELALLERQGLLLLLLLLLGEPHRITLGHRRLSVGMEWG